MWEGGEEVVQRRQSGGERNGPGSDRGWMDSGLGCFVRAEGEGEGRVG